MPSLPEGFEDLYEVHSYRQALEIVTTGCTDDFVGLAQDLMGFRIDGGCPVLALGIKPALIEDP